MPIAGLNPSGIVELAPCNQAFEFWEFVVHEARIDHEYWEAAWLRAESHWEGKETDRFVENYKRMFAEQEFHAMKRRYNSSMDETCSCIIAMKKEDAITIHGIGKKVVGTLDLSITYPERGKFYLFGHGDKTTYGKYGYIANLCVAKLARRQGIASNMLRFAILSAKEDGVEKVFVEVSKSNKAAQVLYRNIGFQVDNIDAAIDQTSLLCLQTSKLISRERNG